MSIRTWNISSQRSFYGLLIGAAITLAYALLWLLERSADAPIGEYLGLISSVEAVQFWS
jgi:hypothetical protein